MLSFFKFHPLHIVVVAAIAWSLSFAPADAQSTAYKQAIAEAAAKDAALSEFYRSTNYKPIWTAKGSKARNRRSALMTAFDQASMHGLPSQIYNSAALKAKIGAARSEGQRAVLEVEMSALFLKYARAIQTGILVPARVDPEIVRDVPYRDRLATLAAFNKSSASGFLKALPPKSPEYTRLMKEKLRLEKLLGKGGWGDAVPAKSLKPGTSGNAVAFMRNRLIRMGFLKRTSTTSYDAAIIAAVQQFQLAHGLETDGVAGPGTMKEINRDVPYRLTQIIVAMERERWNNRPLGDRHIWVNLPDFTAKIFDKGKITFETRSVVGANDKDRRSPEFSDVMDHMVINPSWYVPRSIATKEYLPMLKRNSNAVSHLELRDNKGRTVSRSNVNFASYTDKTFPYSFRQPPSRGNALGLVKFMFPNKYNIYLHDTPAKNLFSREVRAYSHGCIRLSDPFDFAYALLAKQSSNPEATFKGHLATKKEARVNLKNPVPVHIVYRTAFTSPSGKINFRRDMYGRDAKIWNALQREGVALRAVQG